MFSEISASTLDYHISSREEKYALLKVTLGMLQQISICNVVSSGFQTYVESVKEGFKPMLKVLKKSDDVWHKQ
jgi:hypothetical protein